MTENAERKKTDGIKIGYLEIVLVCIAIVFIILACLMVADGVSATQNPTPTSAPTETKGPTIPDPSLCCYNQVKCIYLARLDNPTCEFPLCQ